MSFLGAQQVGPYIIQGNEPAEENQYYMSYIVEREGKPGHTLGEEGERYSGYLIHRVMIHSTPHVSKLHRMIEVQGSIKYPLIQYIRETIVHEDLLLIVLEYEMNSIYSYFPNGSTLTESKVRSIFTEMAISIDYLVGMAVSHLDIRPDAFFIAENGHLRLGSFHFARFIDPGQKISGPYGTTTFSAPEVFADAYNPYSADIWALGIVLLSLFLGRIPIQGSDADETRRFILQKELPLTNAIPDKLLNLLTWMLQRDPAKRPTIRQVIDHEWMMEGRKCSKIRSKPPEKIKLLLSGLGFDVFPGIKDSLRARKTNPSLIELEVKEAESNDAEISCIFCEEIVDFLKLSQELSSADDH